MKFSIVFSILAIVISTSLGEVISDEVEVKTTAPTTIVAVETSTKEHIKNDNITENDLVEKAIQRIQRQTMACASSPCGSNGLCYDVPFPAPLPAGYYCVCNEGFSGTQCEKGNLFVFQRKKPSHTH